MPITKVNGVWEKSTTTSCGESRSSPTASATSNGAAEAHVRAASNSLRDGATNGRLRRSTTVSGYRRDQPIRCTRRRLDAPATGSAVAPGPSSSPGGLFARACAERWQTRCLSDPPSRTLGVIKIGNASLCHFRLAARSQTHAPCWQADEAC